MAAEPTATQSDEQDGQSHGGAGLHEPRRRQLEGWSRFVVRIIAVAFSLFHLYTGYALLLPMYQRVIHVAFGFTLIFLLYPIRKKAAGTRLTWDGILTAALVLVATVYVLRNYFAGAYDVGAEPPLIELLFGALMIVLAIEAARRVIGPIFACLTVIFLLYARFGEVMPGILAHRDYDIERIITGLFMTTEGIYGLLTGISATFIFLFVLFGAFLRVSGAGDFFLNLASSAFGHVRGGPAKIGVVASSFFGMVSGSGLANAASTGQLTIPLMIRTGYRRHFAGAVEAVSSEAGILVPPVMGGTVFIMMEILGVTYVEIIRSVILVAILYYFALFVMVDLEAAKTGLRGVPRDELPRLWPTFRDGWHYLVPPALLIYMLVVEHVSPVRAAFWAIVSVPIISWIRPRQAMRPWDVIRALEEGALTALMLIGVLVCANIIVGIINLTGVGVLLSDMLIVLSQGYLPALLLLAMLAALVLGMGLPMAAAYVILAVLVAPALIQAGVDPLAAHLFIFYYAIVSQITPPVAPTAFVTASIAGAPHFKTAFTACRLAMVIIVLPYLLVYNTHLLMRGSVADLVLSTVTVAIGVYFLALFLQGYMVRPTRWYERLVLLLTALAFLVPGLYATLLGLTGAAVFFGLHRPGWPRVWPLRRAGIGQSP